MKSTTIDNLYFKINRKILLAESYTENKDLSFVIKSCRLKPFSIQKSNKNELTLEKKWIDEFGNSLNIIKNKRLKIIIGDLEINRNKLITSDLYYGLTINKVARISKLLFVLIGKDEDLLNDHIILCFLGIDDRLRTFYVYDGQINICSPLEIGLQNLKLIAKNKDIKYFMELNNKDIVIFPCVEQKSWLTFYPPSKKFLEIISNHSELFSQLINTQGD